jgi:C1A family cysteine protease
MANVRIDLQELAATLSRAGSPWQSGETSMTALSEEERRRRLGVVPPPGAPPLDDVARALRAGPPRAPFRAAAVVGAPPQYDLRNVGGDNYVSAIRDQSSCGSCVAFGVAAVLETTLRIERQDPQLDI